MSSLKTFLLDQHPYRVQPGQKIDFNTYPTRDQQLFDGGKSDGKNAMKDLADRIGDLQEMLYAQGKHKFLFVIQAMEPAARTAPSKTCLNP